MQYFSTSFCERNFSQGKYRLYQKGKPFLSICFFANLSFAFQDGESGCDTWCLTTDFTYIFFSRVDFDRNSLHMTADFTCFFFSGVTFGLDARHMTADFAYFYFFRVAFGVLSWHLVTNFACFFFSTVELHLDSFISSHFL